MRLPIIVLTLALALTGCAPGQAQSLEDTAQSPYFVISSPAGTAEAMPLKATTAEVDIAGVIAEVKVTQVYRNDGKLPLEALYVFPGSTRSAVHALTMTLGDRVIRSQIKEKVAARQDYERAKQEGRRASLLEQHRPNVFQMNVARGTLTVSGISGHGFWSQTFRVDQVSVDENNPALRQLWAPKRIQLLSDYALFGMTVERQREITELGLEYSLLTDFTSFVAVDPQVRNQGPAPVLVTQPLPLPQGVPSTALPGAWGKTQTGSACMAVVAAASDLGGEVALDLPEGTISPLATVSGASEGLLLRLGTLSADRPTTPLGRVGLQLEVKLRFLAQLGLFKDMPPAFLLTLQVDASGAVVAVTFDHPCGKAGKLLELQLLGWRFEAWTLPGTTRLRQAIQVLP